jgi:hypothetical protein
MNKLTEEREITPYTWVSSDDDNGVASNSITAGELSALRRLKLDETDRVLSQAFP